MTITIKLPRDSARLLQQRCFPYITMLYNQRILNEKNNMAELMQSMLLRSILNAIKTKFDQKLIGFAQRFTFNLRQHEGIVLYVILSILPIDANDVYFHSLRLNLMEVLYRQLSMPVTVDQ